METNKITVIIRSVLGGVANYWANLLNELPPDTACVILTRGKNDRFAPIENLFNCKTLTCEYDEKLENKTSVYRRLVNLVPADTTDIIANEAIHIAAAAYCCPSIRIHFVLHGDYDYYYQTAESFSDFISQYFCVGNQIFLNLKKRHVEASKCCVLPPCVPPPHPPPVLKRKPTGDLKITFIGRFNYSKGFDCVNDSINQCAEKRLPCEWTIISSNRNHEIVPATSKNITRIEECSKKTIDHILQESDILILPSRAEGFPLVVVEAMQRGAVPILSDIEVFKTHPFLNNLNSFQFAPEQVTFFVDAISDLNADRDRLFLMQQQAFRDSEKMLPPNKIAAIFTKHITQSKPQWATSRRELCSRLDQSFLPNFLVVILRTLSLKMKSIHFAADHV